METKEKKGIIILTETLNSHTSPIKYKWTAVYRLTANELYLALYIMYS